MKRSLWLRVIIRCSSGIIGRGGNIGRSRRGTFQRTRIGIRSRLIRQERIVVGLSIPISLPDIYKLFDPADKTLSDLDGGYFFVYIFRRRNMADSRGYPYTESKNIE